MKLPRWRKELIQKISKEKWSFYLHPSFAKPWCMTETIETEEKCIKILFRFIDEVNRKAYGNRYKRRKIRGISTAWTLEYADRKGWHLHMLIGNLQDFDPYELYSTWKRIDGASGECRFTPIVRVDDLSSGKKRVFSFNGKENYFVKRVDGKLKSIAMYLTKNCDRFQHRIYTK